jgi:hypothetical protein
MKYLKTNEGLFAGKSQKVFSKLIEDLEVRLTGGGYEFKKEPNKVFLGRSPKDIIKTAEYTINKDDIEYLLKVALVKERSFDNPFVHARVEGKQGDFNGVAEVSYMDLTISSLSIYTLLNQCKEQILSKSKRKNTENSFYEDFPIEDIKDRLLDLSDEFGIESIVSKMKGGDIGYDVNMDLSVKFRKIEHSFLAVPTFGQGGHYIKVDDKMDIYTKSIIEINNLSKTFNSMGLTMFLETNYLLNSGSISFKLFKTEFVVKKD